MRIVIFSLCLLVCACGSASGNVTIEVLGDIGDGAVLAGSPFNPLDAMLPNVRVGSGGDDERGHAAIFFFELPTLASRDSLLDANLRFNYLGFTPFSFPQYVPRDDADLYALGVRPTTDIFTADYYDGDPSGTMDTLIAASLLTPTSPIGQLTLASDSRMRLVDSLRSSYSIDGIALASYAVFRVNMAVDVISDSGDLFGYELATADDMTQNGALVPRLTLTVVPEPSGAELLVFMVLVGTIFVRVRSLPAFASTPVADTA